MRRWLRKINFVKNGISCASCSGLATLLLSCQLDGESEEALWDGRRLVKATCGVPGWGHAGSMSRDSNGSD